MKPECNDCSSDLWKTECKVLGAYSPLDARCVADFLPVLIYVLAQCGMVSAQVEADYMWGLMHPSVLTGEGGYYLTTLSSAAFLLRNFQLAHDTSTPALEVSQNEGRRRREEEGQRKEGRRGSRDGEYNLTTLHRAADHSSMFTLRRGEKAALITLENILLCYLSLIVTFFL